jgi:ankyrin repeat protein
VEDVRDELIQGDIVDVNPYIGTLALYTASYHGLVEIVHELLQNNEMDVNLKYTDDGITALYIASHNGHEKVVSELLRNNKVDVNAQNKNGETALHAASAQDSVDVVCLLLQNYDVDVNAQNTNGETALFQASREGYQEVVKRLLKHNNVNVNLQCNTGATALHVACKGGRVKVVRVLLQNNKVDEYLVDHDGQPAYEVARLCKKNVVLEAFHDHHDALQAVIENRKSLDKVMTTSEADPVELSYHYIKRYMTKQLGSGAFGDVFLVEDNALPEPKKFAVKMIKLIQRSDGANDEGLNSFKKELSVCSAFCIECCLVWNNEQWTHLPRVLTIMHNSARHSRDVIIPISSSCTGTT